MDGTPPRHPGQQGPRGEHQGGLIRRRSDAQFRMHQSVNRPTGSRRTGTSYAMSRSPRGSIQMPRNGRIEKMPPRTSRTPAGTRIQRASGWRRLRNTRATFPGTSCSRLLNARLRIALPWCLPSMSQEAPSRRAVPLKPANPRRRWPACTGSEGRLAGTLVPNQCRPIVRTSPPRDRDLAAVQIGVCPRAIPCCVAAGQGGRNNHEDSA